MNGYYGDDVAVGGVGVGVDGEIRGGGGGGSNAVCDMRSNTLSEPPSQALSSQTLTSFALKLKLETRQRRLVFGEERRVGLQSRVDELLEELQVKRERNKNKSQMKRGSAIFFPRGHT